jgi:hypothetical protein
MLPQFPIKGSLTEQVRTMQIIVLGLMLGVAIFAGIGCVLVFGEQNQAGPQNGNQPAGDDEVAAPHPVIVAYIGAALAGIMVAARFIVPPIIGRALISEVARGRKFESLSKESFFPVYQTKLIVASAMLEGVALFNIVAFIAIRQTWSLGIVVGLFLLLGAGFPTLERLEAWSEDQLRELQMNSV